MGYIACRSRPVGNHRIVLWLFMSNSRTDDDQDLGGRLATQDWHNLDLSWTRLILPTATDQPVKNAAVLASNAPNLSHTSAPNAEPPPTPSKSTPPEHYKVKNLPRAGLSVEEVPSCMQDAPLHIKYECVRISLQHGIPISLIAARYTDSWKQYIIFEDAMQTLVGKTGNLQLPSEDSWEAAAANSEFVIRSGSLTISEGKSDDLFKLTLSPLQVENESCRFFRKFGANRFLKLVFPTKAAETSQRYHYERRIREWLTISKRFLACDWVVFHVRHNKTRLKKNSQVQTVSSCFQAHLFATAGPGLKTISRTELVDWFLPLDLNLGMTYCKAFARLELGQLNSSKL